jgi:hypothetical protein
MLAEIKGDLKSDRGYYRRKRNYYKTHKVDVQAVATEFNLPENAVVNATSGVDDINLRISGGPDTLKAIFHAFRTLGYEPSNRPGIKPESSFTTYFKHPAKEVVFYLSFSSLICKRVKIGTEMKEMPIYETVCE